MKRSAVKRKPKKRRAAGTACQVGKRCLAIGTYKQLRPDGEVRVWRLCALHMADMMMGDSVKREEMCCRYCGTQHDLQWAHVWRRSYRAIRWDRANSMALCATHHMMFTENPAKWETWCREIGVPWDELRQKALNGPPMQAMFVIERLKAA